MRGRPDFAPLFAVALLALPACTLLNAPDPLPATPVDGGLADADDETSPDAGDDAGTDAGPSCRAREICFNGPTTDDDCDGVVDCNDLDCAGNAACCDVGTVGPRLAENWLSAGDWQSVGDPGGVGVAGGKLAFGSDDVLRSLMPSDELKRCLPLVFGARIEVAFAVTPCAEADGGACGDEAAVVLTGAEGPASGRALAADLRVAAGGDGLLRVTSGATSLIPAPVPFAAGGRVVVEVSPGARDGVPVLSARVLMGPDRAETLVVADAAFVTQGNLRPCLVDSTSAAMETVGGLRFAVEGRGAAVAIGPLEASPLACVNPVVFTPAGNVITAAELPGESGWNAGGLGAPALLRDGDAEYLFYDASDVERDLERVAPIDFAIGAADAATFRASWASRPRIPGAAYLGATPPSSCAAPCASVREPTASADLRGGSLGATEVFLLAFARETSGGVFEIAYVNAPTAPNESPGASSVRVLVPPSLDCVSVRDPALAQADLDPAAGLWLFYTCERDGAPATIHAVPLGIMDGIRTPVPGADVEVLGPSIGAYAAQGVRGAAPLVRIRPGVAGGPPTLAVRLWFVATGADGRRTLGLAEGQSTLGSTRPEDATRAPLPVLLPDPTSPLLDGASPALGRCLGTCALEDVAVGRVPGETEVVLLLARRVDDPARGTDWQFVPLGQTLEPRWWGNP
jgi:hypothetical protein